MQCPVDSHTLKDVFSSDLNLKIDLCDMCGGVWLDGGELAKAATHLRATLPQLKGKDALSLHIKDTEQWKPLTLYPCPQDGAIMGESVYAGDSGIFINHCARCEGYWFNGGEIEKLKKYLAPNPLEEAIIQEVVMGTQGAESADLIQRLLNGPTVFNPRLQLSPMTPSRNFITSALVLIFIFFFKWVSNILTHREARKEHKEKSSQ
jgi:Zn-finger nucleic acid-binding protein